MAEKGSTGKAPAKSKAGAQPIAPGAKPGEKADLSVPMAWAAFMNPISNSWSFHGVEFQFPNIRTTLQDIGAPDTHNTVVAPLPKEWVDSLRSVGYGVKEVTGKRLPALKLLSGVGATSSEDAVRIGGVNSNLWSDYQAKHKPLSLSLSREDWRKPLTFRKHSEED